MLEHRRCGPEKLSEQMFCRTKIVSANLPGHTVKALRIFLFFGGDQLQWPELVQVVLYAYGEPLA